MTDNEPSRLAATVDRLRDEVRRAGATDDGQALVEVAKGVLVERLRCGLADAAVHLESMSRQAGLSPLELAARLVAEAGQDLLTVRSTVGGQSGGGRAGAATQTVAQSLVDQALVPLGAVAVAVWAVRPDASLVLAGSAGFTAQDVARWRYVPPGVPTVARRALTERGVVWLD